MSSFGKKRNDLESDSEGEPYFEFGGHFFVLIGYPVYYTDSVGWSTDEDIIQ